MTRGTHTSCPSSTFERPDMTTGGAVRRRPRSLVAHRREQPRPRRRGSSPRSPRRSSTPPVARAGLWGALPHRPPVGLGELDPTRRAAGLGCRPREAVVAWPPASSGSGWAAAVARGGRLHPRGARDRGTGTTGLNAQRLGSEEERSGRRLKINMTCGSHTKERISYD
jgi:hypothetical protein